MHKIRLLTLLGLFLSSVIVTDAALAAPPPNDNRADAKNIDALPYTDTVSNIEATVEADEFGGPYCYELERTVWYRLGASTTGTVMADTVGSNFYTGMNVWRETQRGFELVACGAYYPKVNFETQLGTGYLFQVGGVYGYNGTLKFNVSYAGSIGGIITSETTQAISGLCIYAVRSDNEYGGSAYSNSAGEYLIINIPAGAYRVRFSDCNYPQRYQEQWYNGKSEAQADLVEVLSGGVSAGVNAIMHPIPPIYRAYASVYPPSCEYDQISIWLYNDNNYAAGDRIFEILMDGTIAQTKTLPPFSSQNLSITVPHDNLQHLFEVKSDGSVLASAYAIFRICSDPAVTSFTVTNVPLQTDFGETPVYTGWARRLEAEVQDLTGQGIDAYVDFRVCPINDPKPYSYGYCDSISSQYVRLGSEPLVLSYTWNGSRYVGDVAIVASVSGAEDHDYSNNSIRRDHYVMVGGTGFGTRVGGCALIVCF